MLKNKKDFKITRSLLQLPWFKSFNKISECKQKCFVAVNITKLFVLKNNLPSNLNRSDKQIENGRKTDANSSKKVVTAISTVEKNEILL